MKSILIITFISFYTFAFGQEIPWGKISPEEIALTDVSFEKGAEAVKLQEIGELIINDDNYILSNYVRIKILSIEGFKNAQKKWHYNTDDANDKVTLEEAQTLNFVGGKTIITQLDKKDLIISRNNEIEEIAYAFPNVQVGSIIEYKVKFIRPQNLYNSPWNFQDEIPTLSSKLNLKFSTLSNFKIILKGKLLNTKYRGKNIKKWELTDIPSDNIFNNVYNREDYRERIMLQYSSARKYYGSYYSENSWRGFKKLILKDIDNSKKYGNFKLIADKIENGSTMLETLQNCISFLQNNYKWNRELAFRTSILQRDFLQKKIGNSADFNILLNEILFIKNIKAEFAINSLRSNGRIIIAYPAFAKLQTLVNIVEVENGEKLLIDGSTSSPQKIKYLSLDNFNFIVLGLRSAGEDFTIVSPTISELISQQNLKIEDENSTVDIKNRSTGYFNTDEYKDANFTVFSGISSSKNSKKENNEWEISTQKVDFNSPRNSIFILENPFSKILKDLDISEDRDYPIELDFPYLATVVLRTKLPENYKIETDHFNRKISAFNGSLQYQQDVVAEHEEQLVTWSLLLNKTFFQPNEIKDYTKFIAELKSAFSAGAVIKKK